MIYSCHQMCPALNSKPYWSNKQVVPLLGYCSDAPGSAWWMMCGDWTFLWTNSGSESKPKSDWKTSLQFCYTSWCKLRLFNALLLSYRAWIAIASLATAESVNFFSQKSLNCYLFYIFSTCLYLKSSENPYRQLRVCQFKMRLVKNKLASFEKELDDTITQVALATL